MRERFAGFRRSHEFWLLLVVLAARASCCRLATDSFFTLQNLFDLLTSNAFIGVLCAGLLVVLVAGGIDISFTATASVAQYVAHVGGAHLWRQLADRLRSSPAASASSAA